MWCYCHPIDWKTKGRTTLLCKILSRISPAYATVTLRTDGIMLRRGMPVVLSSGVHGLGITPMTWIAVIWCWRSMVAHLSLLRRSSSLSCAIPKIIIFFQLDIFKTFQRFYLIVEEMVLDGGGDALFQLRRHSCASSELFYYRHGDM